MSRIIGVFLYNPKSDEWIDFSGLTIQSICILIKCFWSSEY